TSVLSFAIIIAPLFGLLLGPTRGFVFGLIGGLLAYIVTLPFGTSVYIWLPLTILGPAFAGLFTGLAMKKVTKIGGVSLPGPILTAIFLTAIIVLYEISHYNAWWFMTPYMLALVIVLLLQVKSIEFNPDRQGYLRYLQLLPYTFIGAMLDHSMMAIGSVYLLALEPAVFGFVIFPLMLLERGLAAIVGAVIASVVLSAFRNAVWIETQISSDESNV
ncbi:MAG: hypothetical protein RTU09_08660, partial [Candidatus Thorarchaeota archaeon]